MDVSEATYQRSRQLTDELKREVKKMVESWFERSEIRGDPVAPIAALAEAAAEVGISFSTPSVTVGLLLHLAASVNESAIMADNASRHAHPTPQ